MLQCKSSENYLNYKLGYNNYKLIMRNGQDNEMRFVLSILKSPEKEYNANSLAGVLGISAVGVLKIDRKLEKEGVIKKRQVGKANIYNINLESDYTWQYVKFLLKREVEKATTYVRVWIRELKKVKSANGVILFGSVLRKEKEARDIDALFIVNKKNFENVKKEVESINKINIKKVHPIYQTREDLETHIKKRQEVVLNALKGIFVSGEDIFLEVFRS